MQLYNASNNHKAGGVNSNKIIGCGISYPMLRGWLGSVGKPVQNVSCVVAQCRPSF